MSWSEGDWFSSQGCLVSWGRWYRVWAVVVVVEKWAVVMRVVNGVMTAMVDEHDCMSHSGIILSWTQCSSVHPGTPPIPPGLL
jgi:hypothetical protein